VCVCGCVVGALFGRWRVSTAVSSGAPAPARAGDTGHESGSSPAQPAVLLARLPPAASTPPPPHTHLRALSTAPARSSSHTLSNRPSEPTTSTSPRCSLSRGARACV
jgi:hypothetical protein